MIYDIYYENILLFKKIKIKFFKIYNIYDNTYTCNKKF